MNSPNNISPEKADEIISAAQHRFGLYGLKKTSMQEIADDLHISKASLYYYFPDKEHLYSAVVIKEQDEMFKVLSDIAKKDGNPAKVLKEYVKIRLSFFKAMLNLNQLRFEDVKQIKPFMGELWNQFQLKEAEIIKEIFIKGVKQNTFKIDNLDETVTLFLDLVRGLRQQVITTKGQFFIDEKEYKTLIKKTNLFTDLFIIALKFKDAI